MKKHRPIKHAHRKAMIAEKKAKGKYSRIDLPKGNGVSIIHCCLTHNCYYCWANRTHYCP